MPKIKVKSKKDREHKIINASGIWGGITPHGMVYFDLFIEKPEEPGETMITVDEKTGRRYEEVISPSEPAIERILLVGITVRPEIARSMGQWLIEKSDEAEFITGQRPDNVVQ